MVSGKVSSFKTTYSFSATIVIEVLAAAKSVNSALISRILPFIEKCFKKGSSEEYEVFFYLFYAMIWFTAVSCELVV